MSLSPNKVVKAASVGIVKVLTGGAVSVCRCVDRLARSSIELSKGLSCGSAAVFPSNTLSFGTLDAAAASLAPASTAVHAAVVDWERFQSSTELWLLISEHKLRHARMYVDYLITSKVTHPV